MTNNTGCSVRKTAAVNEHFTKDKKQKPNYSLHYVMAILCLLIAIAIIYLYTKNNKPPVPIPSAAVAGKFKYFY